MRIKPTKEELVSIKKYLKITLLSIIFGAISLFCFTFSDKEILQKEVQISSTFKKTTTVEDEGLKNFFEYIGLFFLVLAAWQWRELLKFDTLGFMSSKSSLGPTDPDKKVGSNDNIPPATPPTTTTTTTSTTTTTTTLSPDQIKTKEKQEFEDYKLNENLNRILLLMSENPNAITNATIIANKLGFSMKNTELYLFKLLQKKLIRKDTYPGSKSSVYSLSNSYDNLVIDNFIGTLLNSDKVVGDYRYVRLRNRYEIDALIKTTKTNYIVETKYLRDDSSISINRGIQQLLKIEEELDLVPLTLALVLVGDKEILDKIETKDYLIKENLLIVKIEIEKITMHNKL